MKKKVTLVLVPFYPNKLEPGMLMAYKRKKLQPETHDYNPFYLTQSDVTVLHHYNDINSEIIKYWTPVQPYLISNDELEEFENDDPLVFSVYGRLCVAFFDDLLGNDISWVRKVIAGPLELGSLDIELIKKIIKNGESSGGKCEIDMEEKNKGNIVIFS